MHKVVKIALFSLLIHFSSQNLFAQQTEEVYEGEEEVVTEDEGYNFFGDINRPNFVGNLSENDYSRTFDYSKGYNLRNREGYQLFDKSLPMNIDWTTPNNVQGVQNTATFQMNAGASEYQMNQSEPVAPRPTVSADITNQKSIVGTSTTPNNAPRNNDAVPANPDDPGDVPINSAIYFLALGSLLIGLKFKRILQH